LKIFNLINKNINNFNILISVITTSGSIHDSKILNNQLDILNKKHKSIFNQNEIILTIAAYDSEILKLGPKLKFFKKFKFMPKFVSKVKLGTKNLNLSLCLQIITNDENKNIYEFLLLKKRITIEYK